MCGPRFEVCVSNLNCMCWILKFVCRGSDFILCCSNYEVCVLSFECGVANHAFS